MMLFNDNNKYHEIVYFDVVVSPNFLFYSFLVDLLLKDVTALEVELKGECEALNVTVQPYGIYIPGKTLVGTTVRKQVNLTNHSISTVLYQWEPVTEGPIIEVEPPIGEIGMVTVIVLL
jgi:hypothetical protein